MCTVSMVGDYWRDRTVPEKYPNWVYTTTPTPTVSKEEFDELKKDVEALKELLKSAKAYDTAVGEPDCEHGDKVALIKKMAEFVGVDLEDLL